MIDLLIVGAGPTGIYAGILAGMRQLHTVILESLPSIGGQLNTFYPEKNIYDIPGFTSIRADAFITRLDNQLKAYQDHVSVKVNVHVQAIETIEEGFNVITSTGETFRSKTILLTSGAGSLSPRRLNPSLDLDDIEYQLSSIDTYKHQTVAVLGGGDSALDYCAQLYPVAKHVHLIHRRPLVRGLDRTFASLQGHVSMHMPINVDAIQRDEQFTLHLSSPEGKQTSLRVDRIVVAYGFQADTLTLQAWNVALEKGKIKVSRSMLTSLDRIWACGNNVTYEGKVHTIASGFGEANQALDAIVKTLRPGKAVVYSSNLDLQLSPIKGDHQG